MLGIITALYPEAQPFIELMNLKRDLAAEPLQVFTGQWNDAPVTLVVSGIGTIRAAALTGWLLRAAPSLIANIGGAGARPEIPVGAAYLCDRVLDAQTNRGFIPEQLLQSPFPLASLMTSPTPVRSPSDLRSKNIDLVDMEASGILEAASLILGPEQVVVIKIVVDNLHDAAINPAHYRQSIAAHALPTLDFLVALHRTLSQTTSALSTAELELITNLATHLKLTASQRRILFEHALRFRLSSTAPFPDLTKYSSQLEDRQSSKHNFSAVLKELVVSH